MAGNAIAARAIRPDIELIGVEAELYPSFLNALDGQDRSIGGPTLADRPVIRGLVADIVPVSEELIERAVNAYTSLHHTLAEGRRGRACRDTEGARPLRRPKSRFGAMRRQYRHAPACRGHGARTGA